MFQRIFEYFKTSNFNARNLEAQYQIVATSKEITLHHPQQHPVTIEWDELQAIFIQTNDQGPFTTDVYWILQGKTGLLRIPQGAKGEQELLSQVQQLPNFNNEAVIQAMSSSTNSFFVCWRKEDSVEPGGVDDTAKQST